MTTASAARMNPERRAPAIRHSRSSRRGSLGVLLVLAAVSAAGCSSSRSAMKALQATKPAVPAVVVTSLTAATVPIYAETIAQTMAVQTVDLHPQVAGTLQQVLFTEGTEVKRGQVLFVIDPRPYEAALRSAEGQQAQAQANLAQALQQRQLVQARSQLATAQSTLQQAEQQVNLRQAEAELAGQVATLANARRTVERDRALVEQRALAQQVLDNDVTVAETAAASVASARAVVTNTALSQKIAIDQARAGVQSADAGVHDAALQTRIGIQTARAALQQADASVAQARLNVEYTRVAAPTDGLIGVLQVNKGSYVTPSAVLDTVSSIDPMAAQFHVSESIFLRLVKRVREEAAAKGTNPVFVAPFQLILADGTVHRYPGRLRTLDRSVDPKSGTILVQAVFPNPDKLLRAGMFARLRVQLEDRPNTVLVPQAAVQDVQGAKTVFVVDAENKVQLRSITVSDQPYQSSFVVLDGLKAGDRVIVEGVQKVRPGMTVAPTVALQTSTP